MHKFVEILREGGVVAFPTETVYGLGASIAHEEAISQVFALKGRPQDNPLIVHVSSLEQIESFAKPIPKQLAQFWPGPLTVVVEHNGSLHPSITAGLPTVAVRIPDHPVALELIQGAGPLVAPSANRSGKPSPTSKDHVLQDLAVPVVDGGACLHGLESTVISLAGEPTLLRPGPIAVERLEKALGRSIGSSLSSDRPMAPGMKYRHYAPQGKLLLMESFEEIEAYLREKPPKKREICLDLTPEKLYSFLRECDLRGAEEILVWLHPDIKSNKAVINRLLKASS